MWILPKQLSTAYPYALVFGESKEELSELSQIYEQSALSRSKALSSKTWLRRWKSVYWLRLQFGRILKPSTQNLFVERYTYSLPDIAASHFLMLVKEKEQKIQDTSIHTSPKQLTLFAQEYVSSKMSEVTSLSGSEKSLLRWKEWVTECIGEYSVRRKRAQAIREKEFLLWQSGENWTTPVATDSNRTTKYAQGGTVLSLQAKWSTPQNRDFRSPDKEESGNFKRKIEKGFTIDLNSQVSMSAWPTVSARDWKGSKSNQHGKNSRPLNEVVDKSENWPTPTFGGHNNGTMQEWGGSGNKLRGQEKSSIPGSIQELSRARLNMKWVCQLMAITFEKTFFVHLEIQSTHPQQN